MKFRAIIFDLDGTLLDTIEDLADSMNAVLGRAGLPAHDVEAYKRFVGDGIEVLVERALPPGMRDARALRAFVAAMREEYGRRWKVKTAAYEGIEELLETLARRGIKLAVLSNKPDDATKQVVEALLPRARFDVVLGARSGVPRKPDPTAALDIARTLGVLPGECLYVGDSATDVQTAAAAGMKPVGVLWGFRGAAELEGAGAKILISRPAEILDILRTG